MDKTSLTRAPVAKTGMLIRRSVTDVFEAFVDLQLHLVADRFPKGPSEPCPDA